MGLGFTDRGVKEEWRLLPNMERVERLATIFFWVVKNVQGKSMTQILCKYSLDFACVAFSGASVRRVQGSRILRSSE